MREVAGRAVVARPGCALDAAAWKLDTAAWKVASEVDSQSITLGSDGSAQIECRQVLSGHCHDLGTESQSHRGEISGLELIGFWRDTWT
jgi:hypothetical protein